MPAALDHLPLELVHMILAHLDIDCRHTKQPDPLDTPHRLSQSPDMPSWYSMKLQPLLSLCLVSRSFRNIFQPILFQEFMRGCGDSYVSQVYTWDGRLLSFLRTVARRRDLAGFVRRIRIVPHLFQASRQALEKEERSRRGKRKRRESCQTPVVVSDTSPALRKSIQDEEAHDTLHEVGVALGIRMTGQLSAKDLIILLIAALPNLEHCSLFVGPDSIMSSVQPWPLLKAGISQLPLQVLNISVLDSSQDFELDYIAQSLLELSPRLESLNLHRCDGTGQYVPLPSLPNLKHIRIMCSRLNEQTLENILNTCDSLCSFTYEARGKPGDPPFERLHSWDSSDHFELHNAARYLSRHHKTLKSVHIDLRHRGGNIAVPKPFSFRELTALKHLFFNLDEFHSRFFKQDWPDDQVFLQILPSGIESLHLAGHIGKEFPRLQLYLLGLAQALIRGEFRDLKEIRWDIAAQLVREEVVVSVFADSGVDFNFHSWPETSLTFDRSAITPAPNYEHSFFDLMRRAHEDPTIDVWATASMTSITHPV
ncbi:hypothetical protein N7535_000479 [Penicillium sp. DV-2018c]|nr:hypothetical protein N7461_006274 [Penicillium sp. DV-2018c]KAJ5581859.1 hypothetical protein N7535_000479 [Penicillium sp. DV-2018c]